MQEMMKMYNMYGMDESMFAPDQTLILNTNHVLVQKLLADTAGEHTDLICQQLYDLARIANKPLTSEEMTAFIARSNEILQIIAGE